MHMKKLEILPKEFKQKASEKETKWKDSSMQFVCLGPTDDISFTSFEMPGAKPNFLGLPG